MTGTSRIPLEKEIALLRKELQRLCAVVSWREEQLAVLADAVENLRTNPESLARALTDGAADVTCCAEETSENLRILRGHLRLAASEMAENRHAVEALRGSWSWRLTAPLRASLDGVRFILWMLRRGGRGLLQPAKILGITQWLRFGRQVRASGLFNDDYYLGHNPDVRRLRISPLFHFFVFGANEGRDPHYLFSIHHYYTSNPDVAPLRINPLVHYLKWGAYQGRDPHPQFDSSYYLEQNPDVREGGFNPLAHYLGQGVAEGRDPSSCFDTSEYLEQNAEIIASGINPLVHHLQRKASLQRGAVEG